MYDIEESQLEKDLDMQEHILNQDMEKLMFLCIYMLFVMAIIFL